MVLRVLRTVLIFFICLSAFGYFTQAYKAAKVQEALMGYKLVQGEISRDQYENFKKHHNYFKTLFNPKLVWSVD